PRSPTPGPASATPATKYLSTSRELAEFALVHGGLHEFAPTQIVAAGNVFACFANGHFGNSFHDPFEVRLADIGGLCIGRGITKIDCEWHAIANGELNRI